MIYYGAKSITSVSEDGTTKQRVNISIAHKAIPKRGWKIPLTSHKIISNHKGFYRIQQRNQRLKERWQETKWGENAIMKGKLTDSSFITLYSCAFAAVYMQNCNMAFKKK